MTNTHDSKSEGELPHTDEENGMGDVLYGLFPDEDADPVEEVREVRAKYDG